MVYWKIPCPAGDRLGKECSNVLAVPVQDQLSMRQLSGPVEYLFLDLLVAGFSRAAKSDASVRCRVMTTVDWSCVRERVLRLREAPGALELFGGAGPWYGISSLRDTLEG